MTEQQIVEKVNHWYQFEPKRIFVISGYAGCGKTTLARKIPNLLNLNFTRFLAPTGKAALVLENASTIHSYLYETSIDDDGRLHFIRKPKFVFQEQLLIVDEVSMVNEKLLRDLRSLNIPIIGLGDPAQLPPVEGDTTLLDNPDIFLTKVYRNDGGILDLSTDVRQGNRLKREYNNVMFGQYFVKDLIDYQEGDSIAIVRFNKTRQQINNIIRNTVMNFNKPLEVGERLIVLRNNYDSGLMNGSIVTVIEIKDVDDYNEIATVKVSDGLLTQVIDIDLDIIKGFQTKPKRYSKKPDIHEVDYGYAITCHKSQGSEFDNVFVINEGHYFHDHRNWLYTAVTRARKKLYLYNIQ